ncbi:hypothetical protein Y032_0015g2681 [Ancylostoma ceylanicum]|uniref:Uncharacterized protein n=1 Tax=Ancylostoma ceylanicum TaxID=53326 RepID=A0A016V8B3_9BILA|nr:hypothetical protein Y032_0015g2681 [Ancylostoma ceylanicum]
MRKSNCMVGFPEVPVCSWIAFCTGDLRELPGREVEFPLSSRQVPGTGSFVDTTPIVPDIRVQHIGKSQ